MLNTNNQRTYPIKLTGGLDTETAPGSKESGNLIGSMNYVERVGDGGYDRVGGYERFDGRPYPSDAEIVALQAETTWLAGATFGAIGTGAISGASGVICYYSTTQLALTKVTGTFISAEQIIVSGLPVGIANTSPSVDQLVINEMMAGAEAVYRADITVVPGAGPICGVCVVGGSVYAFRDNVGGTAQDVWKATSSGWTAVPLYNRIRFSSGSIPGYGGGSFTMTQGGVTAMVYKVMVESGDLLDGDAVGTMIVGAPSGGSITLAAATGLGGTFTVTNGLTPIVLYPGGRWQFKPYRFSLIPSAVDEVVYGVDRTTDIPNGGGNFIEFDGSVVAPMTAGGIDGPYRLEAHKNHLFIVYRKTSIQFSGLGDPYRWTVLSGAGEMLAGEEVTEMLSVQGSEDQAAMLIMCLNRTFILYGNASDTFKLTPLSRQIGAKKYSAQSFVSPVALDDQGIRSFSPTANFGNFSFNTLTNHIRKNVIGKTPTASAIDRNGGHYRVFFDDGNWLSGTPKKRWSWMPCKYPFTVNFAQDWELDGEAVIFAGGDSGYVYMLDRGRSFDGESIEAWGKTAYSSFGIPTQRKTFKRLEIEIIGKSAGTIAVQPDYSYGDTAISANVAADVSNNPIAPPATPWDLGEWDKGTWDSKYASLVNVRSGGAGENVSLLFYSNSANQLPHYLSQVIHYYIMRKQKRA